jgi:hypothetical protein
MTDIEDSLQFIKEVLLIIEFRLLPIERMACRRLEAAFANCRHGELLMKIFAPAGSVCEPGISAKAGKTGERVK